MGVFDEILTSDQSLIKNENVLEYEFMPKSIPHRENEQKRIAVAIQPLFNERTGRNLLIHGSPGIGKTLAVKRVLDELEEKTDEIHVVYLNCWKFNTTYKVICEICTQLGFRLTQNKNTNELFQIVKNIVNKSSCVFVFDEVDKIEDFDFLYFILEEVYKKSVCLITNYKSWMVELDERIKSRLVPELLEFRTYTQSETESIIKDRVSYAFHQGVYPNDVLKVVVDKTFDAKDIRHGLFLLKESALIAENQGKKEVSKEDVLQAIKKQEDFSTKNPKELDEEPKFILKIVKKNPSSKIGDLFRNYQKEGGKVSYKTFQRKLAWLEQNKFISLTRQQDSKGNTTIVNKRLTDF